LSGVGTTIVALPGGVDTASVLTAGCVVGTGFGAVCVAVRLARFEVACDSLPPWFGARCGVAGETTIGFSVCEFCADEVCVSKAARTVSPSDK
jgi:hypothetical protein